MKIGIVGAGSIGLLIASYLAKEHTITLYVKRLEQMDILNKFGIHVLDKFRISVCAKPIEHLHEEDLIIICVKQHQLNDVIKQINHIDSRIPLLFLQNGMGHLSLIQEDKKTVFVGVVEHGAIRKNDYTVDHLGSGKIKLALYKGESEYGKRVSKVLSQKDFQVEFESNWKTLLAKKLVVNAIINPLTAIFDVENREIVKNRSIRILAQRLCQEACNVLQLDFQTEWKRVKEIALNTGNNYSSMLEDIRNYRKTEIEAISLFLLNISKNSLPYTNFVYYSVKALEEKKGIQ